MGKLEGRSKRSSYTELSDSDSDSDTLVERISSAKEMNLVNSVRDQKLLLRGSSPDMIRVPTATQGQQQQQAFLTQGGDDTSSECSHKPTSFYGRKRPQSKRAQPQRSRSAAMLNRSRLQSRMPTPHQMTPPPPPEVTLLEHVLDLPCTSKIRQEKVIDFKRSINQRKSQVVNDKMHEFMKTLTITAS